MQSVYKCISMALLSLMMACTSVSVTEPEPPIVTEPGDGSIAFTTGDFLVMPTTRSKDPLTSTNLANPDQLFGVYTIYTGRDHIADCTSPMIYSSNHLFYHFDTKNLEDNYLWVGAVKNGDEFVHTPLFWPIDPKDYVTFYAYAPYEERGGEDAPQIISAEIRGVNLAIDYRPDNVKLQRQLDLSIAHSIIDKKKETDANAVMPLEFEHCLTRVQLYGRYEGNLPEGFTVRITRVKLKNILGRRSVTINSDPSTPTYIWDASDYTPENMVDYELLATTSYLDGVDLRSTTDTPLDPGSTNFAIANNYTVIQKYDGILILVPQEITAGQATIEVDYEVYKDGKLVAPLHDEIDLPTSEWNPNHIYNYYITVLVGEISQIEIIGKDIGIRATYNQFEDSGNTTPELVIK